MSEHIESKTPPKSLLAKIVAVSNEIPSLDKSDTNPHARYKYVPIDGFYKEVATIAKKHGLLWNVKEVGCEVVGNSSTKSGPVPVFRYRYEFDIYDKDGNYAPCFASISILHPLQGPQTSGSAMSYAEKLMMRSVFKVVTGERDADEVDPALTNALGIRKSRAEWVEISADILDQLGKSKGPKDKQRVLDENKVNIVLMKEQVNDLWAKIVDAADVAVVGKTKSAPADIDF